MHIYCIYVCILNTSYNLFKLCWRVNPKMLALFYFDIRMKETPNGIFSHRIKGKNIYLKSSSPRPSKSSREHW